MTQLILSKIPKGKPDYIQIDVNLILGVERIQRRATTFILSLLDIQNASN